MVDWRRRLTATGRGVDGGVARLKVAARRRLGRLGRQHVHAYRGYGTERELWLRARVLRGGGMILSSAEDTVWRNVRNMVRRLESDEVRYALLRGRFGDQVAEGTADSEGYVDLHFELDEPPVSHTTWLRVELEVIAPSEPDRPPRPAARAPGFVLVPRGARFGVISDLDDTVIHSSVTELFKMLRIVFTTNPHTRLPFKGVADLYRALQAGPEGDGGNPIFYVSSSPWNLHDLLVEFMVAHAVPLGPLFLRDWTLRTIKGGGEPHKLETIDRLLRTYPDLPFVLIGDSGEKDPEIYARIVREHPGRVLAVYIREVGVLAPIRRVQVDEVVEELRGLGVDLVVAKDTRAVAAHAARIGLIVPGTGDDLSPEPPTPDPGPTPGPTAGHDPATAVTAAPQGSTSARPEPPDGAKVSATTP